MSEPSEPSDELAVMWRAAPDPPLVALEKVKSRSAQMRRQVTLRNAREYLAGAGSAAIFVVLGLRAEGAWVYRAGCLLVIVALFFVLARLRRTGSAGDAVAPDATAAEHIAHLRAELVRQRDLTRDALRWYVAPLVPGIALCLVGATFERMPHRFHDHRLVTLAIAATFAAAVLTGVVLANRWAARKLDAEIAALG